MHDVCSAGSRHLAQILVVEDNVQVVELLAEFLRRAGYGVHEAHNGLDAVTTMAGSTFDAVLLDLTLPDADGLEVLRRIRALDAGVPIIVMTGHLDEALAGETVRAGAFDYIEKPFTFRSLTKAIAAAIHERRRNDE